MGHSTIASTSKTDLHNMILQQIRPFSTQLLNNWRQSVIIPAKELIHGHYSLGRIVGEEENETQRAD